MEIALKKFQVIDNFSPVRAVVEVEYGGLLLRGLKLEEHGGEYRLASAGRKIGGGWQLVYEVLEPALEARLRERLVDEYLRRRPVLARTA